MKIKVLGNFMASGRIQGVKGEYLDADQVEALSDQLEELKAAGLVAVEESNGSSSDAQAVPVADLGGEAMAEADESEKPKSKKRK